MTPTDALGAVLTLLGVCAVFWTAVALIKGLREDWMEIKSRMNRDDC